jgi:hypothetical protein
MEVYLATLLASVIAATSAVATQSSAVGKNTSVFSDDLNYSPVAANGFTASVAVPSKYKSKSNFLLIRTTVQENCSGGGLIFSKLTVGGVNAFPDPSGLGFFECASNGGYETRTRTWYLLPESAGGSPIAPGSMVTLTLTSFGGTEHVDFVSVQVESTK